MMSVIILWQIYQLLYLAGKLLISNSFTMNSVTNHFLILSLVNSHSGLNIPNEYFLKKWQVFVGKSPAVKVPEHQHPMVPHDENSSALLCCACGGVEPPEGPANSEILCNWTSPFGVKKYAQMTTGGYLVGNVVCCDRFQKYTIFTGVYHWLCHRGFSLAIFNEMLLYVVKICYQSTC